MGRRRKIFAFSAVGAALAAISALMLQQSRTLPLPVTVLSGDAAKKLFEYAWLSRGQLLGVDASGRIFKYELDTDAIAYLGPLNDSLAALHISGPSPISVYGGKLLLYNYGAYSTNWLCCLAKLDGTILSVARVPAPIGYAFCDPAGSGCLEIPFDLSKPSATRSIQGFARGELENAFNPAFPVGFVGDSVFVFATNAMGSFPKEITLEYWPLGATRAAGTRKRVTLGGEEIAAARASPSGQLILWETLRRGTLPRLKRTRKFPYLRWEVRYSTRFYLSHASAEHFKLLGELPGAAGNLVMRWGSDDSFASFRMDYEVYILRVK